MIPAGLNRDPRLEGRCSNPTGATTPDLYLLACQRAVDRAPAPATTAGQTSWLAPSTPRRNAITAISFRSTTRSRIIRTRRVGWASPRGTNPVPTPFATAAASLSIPQDFDVIVKNPIGTMQTLFAPSAANVRKRSQMSGSSYGFRPGGTRTATATPTPSHSARTPPPPIAPILSIAARSVDPLYRQRHRVRAVNKSLRIGACDSAAYLSITG